MVEDRFSTSEKFNSKNTGAILGGDDTKPENSTRPKTKAITVTPKIPKIIAPGTFLTERTVINRKPIAARKVSGALISPSDR